MMSYSTHYFDNGLVANFICDKCGLDEWINDADMNTFEAGIKCPHCNKAIDLFEELDNV